MKIKELVEIINKNQEFTSKIVKCKQNLDNLNYLQPNGELIPFVKEQVEKGVKLEEALLDYDRKIIKYNNLDAIIKEYKDWLEQEI
jgi:hypothetical protein